MGRSGVTDTTSLLNIGEGHLTFVRERVSSFLRLSKRQTALLPLPRKGMGRTCCCGSRCFLTQPEGVWVSTTKVLMKLETKPFLSQQQQSAQPTTPHRLLFLLSPPYRAATSTPIHPS